MLSQSLDDFYRDSSLDLKGYSLKNVREITLEGSSTDGITARLRCNPTEDRTVTVPDRTFTINAAGDLSGTTLPSSIVNSSLQKLGVQAQDLDMGSYSISSATDITATGDITCPSIYSSNINNEDEDSPVVISTSSSFGSESSQIHDVAITGSTISKATTGTLTISGFKSLTNAVSGINLIGAVDCKGYDVGGIKDLTCVNLSVTGTTTSISTETVTIEDNVIQLNSNQTGIPLSTLVSGIEVNRGTQTPYQFMYEEESQRFVVGKSDKLQQVATRQNSPDADAIPYWNNTENRFDTLSTLTKTTVALKSEITTALAALKTDSIPEAAVNPTNKYFTNARAQEAMSGLYEVPLTFNSGLSRASNTISLSSSQSISTLSNLSGTGNAFLKLNSSGVLSRDEATYQSPLSFSTGLTNTAGTVTINSSQSISTLSNLSGTGNAFLKLNSSGVLSRDEATYQSPLSFSTGLTNTAGTVTVNASQSISTLSNLTGSSTTFLKISSTGALSRDTTTSYQTPLSFSTGLTNTSGTITASGTQALNQITNLSGTGTGFVKVDASGNTSRDNNTYLTGLTGGVITTSGSAASLVDGAVDLRKLSTIGAGTLLGNATAGALSPLPLDAATARGVLGLGTAASVQFGSVTATSFTGTASVASTVSTTNLGKTGNIATATLTTASQFSNLPIGYSNLLNSTNPATGIMPNATGGFYLNKMGNRDASGGWWGLATDWNSGPLYLGRAIDNTVFATWSEIVDTSSNQTLTGKSIASTQLTGTIPSGRLPSLAGDVTMSAGTNTTSISNLALNKLASIGNSTILGNNIGSSGPPIALNNTQVKSILGIAFSDISGSLASSQIPALSGDVSNTGGSVTISAGVVGLPKMSNLAANSIIGNNTGVSATPIALNATQVKSMLGIAFSDIGGSLASSQIPALSGDVSNTGGVVTISNGVVGLPKLANLAANSLIGNATGASAVPTALSATQTRNLLGLGTNDYPAFRGVTVQNPDTGANPSLVGMQFGGTDIYAISNGANQPIGINPKGNGEVFLNGPVNTLRVNNSSTLKSVLVSFRSVTAGTYNLNSTDYMILAKSDTGTVNINLPDASTNVGRILIIKCTLTSATNKCTIFRSGSDLLEFGTVGMALTSYVAVTLIADTGNWYAI